MPSRLERELVLLERRLQADLRAELDRRLLELKRDLQKQVDGLDERLTTVHSRALRALTHRTERGAP